MVTKVKDLLHRSSTKSACLVCTNKTRHTCKCRCKLRICKKCLSKWLGRKRQCMICQDDLIELEEWKNHWMNEDLRDDMEDMENDHVQIIAAIAELTLSLMDDYELTEEELRFFWFLLITAKWRLASVLRDQGLIQEEE